MKLSQAELNAIVARLTDEYGVIFPGAMDMLPTRDDPELGRVYRDIGFAMDAQPALITVGNSGIPAFLTSFIDPEVVRVLVSPMKATDIAGEQKKGTWVDQTAMFPMAESTGEVSTYGDYSNNGSVNSNNQWVNRQSYLFQTVTQWGELELDRAGAARINRASDLNVASALIMAKFMNKSYFFGIANLLNYGLLNDPSLQAPISPAATGTSGGTLWSTKDGGAIYGDLVLLYMQLVIQSKGLVERDTQMTLALSPEMEANFTKTNQYNVNVSDQLKKNFPNLKVVTAVEYNTTGGQLVQLFANALEGQQTAITAFNEKMRAHPVIVAHSSWSQKKTGGTWGAIIRRPFAIAQMLGI